MTRARDLAAFVSNADGDVKFDTDTLFIDSSANRVGIRKTDPDVPLHIDMGTDNNALYIESSDQFANIGLVDGSGSGKIVMDGGELAFTTGGNATTSFTNSAERMRLDGSGNVGIGTVSPSQKLHVEGAGNQFMLLNNSSTNDGFYFKAGTGASSIQTNSGSNIMNFFTSGTERMRLLSGGGLTFNGDTAAANALNDYETGTWTPTASAGASGVTVTAANCIYVKVGSLLNLTFEISNLTSPNSSTFNLGGLPFAPVQESTGSIMYNNTDMASTRSQIVAYASPNGYLRFYSLGDNTSWQALIGNNLGTTFNIIGTITYQTA